MVDYKTKLNKMFRNKYENMSSKRRIGILFDSETKLETVKETIDYSEREITGIIIKLR